MLGFYLIVVCCAVNCVGGRIIADLCSKEGGVCVPSGLNCSGWVEPYDNSCGLNVCCKPAPVTANPEPPRPNSTTCGKITRVPDINSMLRIVGGDPALEGQWPWQVSIVDSNGDHFCGGTLISPEFVVTAAHCFVSHTESDIEVVLGEHHQEYASGNEIRRNAHIVVKHTGNSKTDNLDDIAFIQLNSPVDVSGHYVRTACLPPQDALWTQHDLCYVSGWGYTKGINDGRHLQQLRVSIVENSICKSAWGTDANVTDSQICAGTGTTGTCQGDSGGPLVCLRNGSYYLAGVTSFGYLTCRQNGYPDVFTRMTSYLEWMTPYMLLLKAIT